MGSTLSIVFWDSYNIFVYTRGKRREVLNEVGKNDVAVWISKKEGDAISHYGIKHRDDWIAKL
jgi:hypothetical protein